MTDLQIFGENVRFYRKKKKLTQLQLAERLGYEKSSIGKIETGLVDVPYSKLMGLANALDCSPLDLLPSTRGSELSPLEEEILWTYRRMSPTEQNMVLRVLGIEEKGDVKESAG